MMMVPCPTGFSALSTLNQEVSVLPYLVRYTELSMSSGSSGVSRNRQTGQVHHLKIVYQPCVLDLSIF